MKSTFRTARTSMFALPLVLVGGMAAAGGLSEPVAPPPVIAPAPVVVAPSADWTGFYAGAQLGYGQLDADEFGDVDVDGATFGAHAGYLADFGSWVLGGELQLDGTNIESSDAALVDLEVDTITRALLRVGYDAGDFLPYATAGIAQVRTSGAEDADDTGGVFGLGAEYRVSPAIRIGAEVLQHQFDDYDGSGIDVDATTAAARVSFQF